MVIGAAGCDTHLGSGGLARGAHPEISFPAEEREGDDIAERTTDDLKHP